MRRETQNETIEVSPNAFITIKVEISNLPIKRDFPCGFKKNSGIGCSQKTCLKQSYRKIENGDIERYARQILTKRKLG